MVIATSGSSRLRVSYFTCCTISATESWEPVEQSANPPPIGFGGYRETEKEITLAVSPWPSANVLTAGSGDSGIALPSDHPVEEVIQEYIGSWNSSSGPPRPVPGGGPLEASVRPKESSR